MIMKDARFIYTQCSKDDSQAAQQEAVLHTFQEIPPAVAKYGPMGQSQTFK